MFLFVSVFGCQGLAEKKNQIKKKDMVVKKSPLNITLNNEDYGTTAETSVLAKKLEEIFKDRGKNGVFREESNEIAKTVYLQGDRSAPAVEIAKLFGAVEASGASPILIPVLIISPVQKEETDIKPNPLILRVYASSGKANLGISGRRDPEEVLSDPENTSMIGEIEISFMGELFENRSSGPGDKGAITVVADKNGTFTMDGTQMSASDLKIKIESRLKAKEKDKKIIFVNADNYGNIEDAAGIAASAGAVKVYVITKNIEQKENGISFSLSPAYIKDKDQEQIPENPSVRFKGSDSSFEITLSDELVDKECFSSTEIG
jgi:biopolymer transport protein ExbD